MPAYYMQPLVEAEGYEPRSEVPSRTAGIQSVSMRLLQHLASPRKRPACRFRGQTLIQSRTINLLMSRLDQEGVPRTRV